VQRVAGDRLRDLSAAAEAIGDEQPFRWLIISGAGPWLSPGMYPSAIA